jgi:radical SAM superfamily enzyme YgiQ (UPF0313 family)
MNRLTIFLGDLTHVTPLGYGTEMTPYPVACIKSWFMRYSKYASTCQVRLFKHPQRFINAFLTDRPGVVGLSNYMWNLDLSYQIATQIKRRFPETLVIFGGPNYPLEDRDRERWLRNHPAVDVYVIGEGEESFTKLVDLWHGSRQDFDAVKRSGIDGCHALVDDELAKSNNVSPRIQDLDLIPSPYLAGYLDEFLEETALTPLLESNRGCPFQCTFCVDGIAARTKVYWKSPQRFEEELTYIAQRYRGKVLDMADVNFGMYKQDLQISAAIARTRERYGYPAYLHVATGKNQKVRVLECAELLKGALRLSASVQSLDREVLVNIKRQNISTAEILKVAQASNATDANTYSEVILGLPGDTKEKHMSTVFELADADMKLISMFTLMMMDGTELTTTSSRERWRLGTRFRIVPRCFGIYDFAGTSVLSAEPEEVAVESATMSFEDYLDCREFALTMGLFYQDRILFELYRFLRNFSIRPSDLLRVLHARRSTFSTSIRRLYQSFNTETRNELWKSREALERFVRSDAAVIQKFIAGELANNVLFRHRAIALLDMVDDIHDAAFSVASELLAQRDAGSLLAYGDYLLELKRFSALRKRNLFDLDEAACELFHYDLHALFESDFSGLPHRLDQPLKVVFYRTEDQRDLLSSQFAQYGRELNGIGRIVSRIAISKLQRAVAFDGVASTAGAYTHTPGFKLSPGEFA